MRIALDINGRSIEAEVEAATLLVAFLREHMGLTGTHVGCDSGQCGACTIHLDGRAVKACLVLAVQADGRRVTTIEGVAAPDGALHPLQEAFRDHHALQCGFCTPGMVMTGLDLAETLETPDEWAIRAGLSGTLCRCTGYTPIVEAIADAVAARRERKA
ncbi:MAG: (2Fe-2S)-binding protein [Magnetospirillum sp.]|nr:(2Fe-2S)-binding protein [Magnetospirillum sp.]